MHVGLAYMDGRDHRNSDAARGGFATGLHLRLGMGCDLILGRRKHTKRTKLTHPSQYHNESVLKKYQQRLKVGTLKESAKL